MKKHNPAIVIIGSLNMDIVIAAERQPRMGETIMGQSISFLPGGKGANQAVAAQRLGARTSIIGAVGEDAFGQQLMTSLEKEGIATHGVKKLNNEPTGTASILLAQRDNCITVVSGANSCCTPKDIDRHISLIKDADIILLQLEIPLETVQYAAKKAKEFGKRVILNPAPAQELPDDLLMNIDYLTPNLSELQALTNSEKDAVSDLVPQLLAKKVGHVIVTLGKDGAAFARQDGMISLVPSHPVQAVDTTGAGDAFNAGLAYSLGVGKSLEEAVLFANSVAALSVTKYGAQNGMPMMDSVIQYAAEYSNHN